MRSYLPLRIGNTTPKVRLHRPCHNPFKEADVKYGPVNLSGERRIRVHTLGLPITTSLEEVINSADQQAVACLLGKMGRSTTIIGY